MEISRTDGFLVTAFLLVLGPHAASAQVPPGAGPWKTDRPVKAVVVGASIAAFTAGNFGQRLQGACANLEVRNIAHEKDKAREIRHRFEAGVLNNRHHGLENPGLEHWLFVLGGLNEIWVSSRVNLQLLVMFRKAHAAGMKVAGLSLTPWGSNGDPGRWRGLNGLQTHLDTKRVVDFILGRLTPKEALGTYAGDMTYWPEGDLPDIRVDLWDSPLRAADARLRAAGPLRRALKVSRKWRNRVSRLPEEAREAEWNRLTRIARQVQRYYLRRDLRSFDSTHPNREGHRIIAAKVCEQAPVSWGCDCPVLRK